MHAQPGALPALMLALGVTDDGSSSVPARTTAYWGRAEESANKWLPPFGQKRRLIRLPLSAVLLYALSEAGMDPSKIAGAQLEHVRIIRSEGASGS